MIDININKLLKGKVICHAELVSASVNKIPEQAKQIFNVILLFIFLLSFSAVTAQVAITGNNLDLSAPAEYEIGGITVSGVQYLDKNVLIGLSGLAVGDKITIPGDDLTSAIEKLWEQGLFSDVKIVAEKIQGNTIFLGIQLEERPRLSRFSFRGVRKAEADDLRESLKLIRGQVVTQNVKTHARGQVKKYFIAKGFLNTEVNIIETPDTALRNNVILYIEVKKNDRIKINAINFEGNTAFKDSQLKRYMKDTKEKRWYGIFKTSKFLEDNFEKDKKNIIAKYNAKGYRDARIVRDSVYKVSDELVNIDITIDEGAKYYFRNVNWVGNTKYSDKALNTVLGIKPGDTYDQSLLEARLFMNPNGRDISSLYMDDGYLFFQVTPVEVRVEGDSIDLEMRVYEGKQARINRVTITGNTKTHDHVIMREIRTKPGQLFSRSDIIRTQRELAQLGYFDPEKLNVNPKPNPAEGTVDIEYVVEEKSSDQIELSGGFGQGRVVGTLGVSFNNFSARNFFKKDAWAPLPSGDGQRLSIRAQSTGAWYQSYNISFTEPWLGGRKPNALSITAFHSVATNGEPRYTTSSGSRVLNERREALKVTGVSVGLGKRLQWPDDYFQLYQEVSFQHYELFRWRNFLFNTGDANNLNYRINLTRSSIDAPIYPRSGSQTSLSIQVTPPYSLLGMNDLTGEGFFKWAEYHKWKFTTSWFTRLIGDLVLNTKAGFGFLGRYNKQFDVSPFERFYLGGSGMSGMGGMGGGMFLGQEIIALRGYPDNSLSPFFGNPIISKYTMELRYPVSLNPNATFYGLVFAEAGNTWANFKDFNPFEVRRAAGVGVRAFLPMFGMLGLDYGWPFDNTHAGTRNKKGDVFFTIGFNLGEL